MIKVFYDGKCGICSKEINYYKKIAAKDIFAWIDITEIDDSILNDENLDKIECLKILHVKDINNNLYKGIDAFILIWQQLQKWKILARLVNLPIIYSIFKVLYNLFAKYRFKQIKYCNTDKIKGRKK